MDRKEGGRDGGDGNWEREMGRGAMGRGETGRSNGEGEKKEQGKGDFTDGYDGMPGWT